MPAVEETCRRFIREHPDLGPVLRAMIDIAREGEAQPENGLGEFCHDWLAAREPRTPRSLRVFENAALIRESPRGTGSGRKFYVLADRAAVERAMQDESDQLSTRVDDIVL